LIKVSKWRPAPRPVERSIFAIGDIHGYLDPLRELLAAIEGHIAKWKGAPRRVSDSLAIFLGDYMDRGPRGLACWERVKEGVKGAQTIRLPGNHEQLLVWAIDEYCNHGVGRWQSLWLANGGDSVLKELDGLGIDPKPKEKFAPIIWARNDFTESMKVLHREGEYLFVHAGVDPQAELPYHEYEWWMCRPDDSGGIPLWIRNEFLRHKGPYPENVFVIHGHTINPNPDVQSNRIGIDTGVFRGGPLTCLELHPDMGMRFIQAFHNEEPWSR
jgi:serine/threonine protein phosphatase 1